MSTIDDRMSLDRILKDRPEQLAGFSVIAIDGEAGRVAQGQARTDDRHLAVHVSSGLLGLFGSDVAVEYEAIDGIDPEARQVHVNRITEWVKASPRVDHA